MTAAEIADLRRRLADRPRSDTDLGRFAAFRQAGVLVPILAEADGPRLLFTVRSHDLRHHPGQIAFPGGGCEPGEDAAGAARREAQEEVGLDVPASAIVGRLTPLPSPARYLATPFVAVVPPPERLRLDPREVADAFTVPLADLLAHEPEREVRQLDGVERTLFRYRWHDRDIWGFTGSVVHEFLSVVRRREPAA